MATTVLNSIQGREEREGRTSHCSQVLSGGVLAEQGPPAQLLAREGGMFAGMARAARTQLGPHSGAEAAAVSCARGSHSCFLSV